jgi:hypothetical protein
VVATLQIIQLRKNNAFVKGRDQLLDEIAK